MVSLLRWVGVSVARCLAHSHDLIIGDLILGVGISGLRSSDRPRLVHLSYPLALKGGNIPEYLDGNLGGVVETQTF